MTSSELREKFVSFFKDKGHVEECPSSLIPKDDPSVLFTSAGMQQFKKYYLDPDKAKDKKIVTIQPCIRTSDIDEVGDESHLTFFEMMGNFSFGDYFKKEAIEWAKEFLEKELGVEPERITTSVFKGDKELPQDKESIEILKNLGYEEIELCGRDENFWGPTGSEGPCGPTVEFYIDGMEVWNLVFNEYYKTADGKFEPLKQKGVDTGIGLERIAAIMEGEKDIYKTELFWPVIKKIEELSSKKYKDYTREFRIIADHVKAAIFLASEEIEPSNVSQGYVLRRLIRRTIVKARQLGIQSNLADSLVEAVIQVYKSNGLIEKKDKIIRDLKKEEDRFKKTLSLGLRQFERMAGGFGAVVFGGAPKKRQMNGGKLFDLYQTYGFPLELSLEIAKEKNVPIEKGAQENFQAELKKHQEISRAGMAKKFKSGLAGHSEKEIKYHTATHILHETLRQVLGDHVEQKGQNITPERLRFDFSHPEKLTKKQLKEIEQKVNEVIAKNLPVKYEEVTVEEAKKQGARAQFLDKYKGKVTMYSVGDYSKELCKGPHLEKTGKIGKFKIVKEKSSGAGVRRIKAIISKQ